MLCGRGRPINASIDMKYRRILFGRAANRMPLLGAQSGSEHVVRSGIGPSRLGQPSVLPRRSHWNNDEVLDRIERRHGGRVGLAQAAADLTEDRQSR